MRPRKDRLKDGLDNFNVRRGVSNHAVVGREAIFAQAHKQELDLGRNTPECFPQPPSHHSWTPTFVASSIEVPTTPNPEPRTPNPDPTPPTPPNARGGHTIPAAPQKQLRPPACLATLYTQARPCSPASRPRTHTHTRAHAHTRARAPLPLARDGLAPPMGLFDQLPRACSAHRVPAGFRPAPRAPPCRGTVLAR